MLTYRKDEIMDLISAINKVLDNDNDEIQSSKMKKIPSDLGAKRDKMQNELNSIYEELFELEKKYGEYKRPEIKRDVEQHKEEDQVEQVEEEKAEDQQAP